VTSVQIVSRPPSMLTIYPRALAGPLLQRGGGELPDTELRLDDAALEPERLEAYREVCGFGGRGRLPATAPHLLAFPLAMKLMTDGSFPFAVLGLVHVANRAELLRPIDDDEPLDLRVRAEDLRDHPRGRQFDIVAEAYASGEEVWRSRSTYLRRGGGEGRGKTPRDTPATPPRPRAYWSVPGDIGRRYASVSGDRNPIHLHPLTARLFGFDRPIAHGMWLKGRCLAELEGDLPEAYAVEVEFKLPLPLPGRVAFAAPAGELSVRDAGSGRPHLTGTVRPWD
jgi:acyl dehydratase